MTASSSPVHAPEGPESTESDPDRVLKLSDTAMEGTTSAGSTPAGQNKGLLSVTGGPGSSSSVEGQAMLPSDTAMDSSSEVVSHPKPFSNAQQSSTVAGSVGKSGLATSSSDAVRSPEGNPVFELSGASKQATEGTAETQIKVLEQYEGPESYGSVQSSSMIQSDPSSMSQSAPEVQHPKGNLPEASRSGIKNDSALDAASGALLTSGSLNKADSGASTSLVHLSNDNTQVSSQKDAPVAHDAVAAVKDLIAQPRGGSSAAPSAVLSTDHAGHLRAFGSIQYPADSREVQDDSNMHTDSSSMSSELRLRNPTKKPLGVSIAPETTVHTTVHTSEKKPAPEPSSYLDSLPNSESGLAGVQVPVTVMHAVKSTAKSRAHMDPPAQQAFHDAQHEFSIPSTRSSIAQASGLFKPAIIKKASNESLQGLSASGPNPSSSSSRPTSVHAVAAGAKPSEAAGTSGSASNLKGLKLLSVAQPDTKTTLQGGDGDGAVHAAANPVNTSLEDKEDEYHTPKAHRLGDNDLESYFDTPSSADGSSMSLKPAAGGSSKSIKRKGGTSRHLFSSEFSAQLQMQQASGASSRVGQSSQREPQGINVVGPNPDSWAPPVEGDLITPREITALDGAVPAEGETKDLNLIDIKRTMSEEKLMTRKLIGNGIESEEQSVSIGGEGITAIPDMSSSRPEKLAAPSATFTPGTPSVNSSHYQTRSPDGSLRNEMLPLHEQADEKDESAVAVPMHGQSALTAQGKPTISLKPQKLPESSAPVLSIGTAVHMATTAVRANLLRDKGFLYEQVHTGGTHTTYLSENFTLTNFVAVLRVNVGTLENFPGSAFIGPRKIHVEAKLRDSVAIVETPGRPVWDLNFAKGATPQYLWVPRVEDDGYKGTPASKAAAGAASAQASSVSSSGMKGHQSSKDGAAAAAEAVGAPGGMLVHKGAPPEIEFQVKRKNKAMLFRTLQLPGDWFDANTPIRRVLTLQEKRLRQQLRTSVYENAGKLGQAPKLHVEICVMRLRPSGWLSDHSTQPVSFHTVGDSHMHVPALLYSPRADKRDCTPAHASAPLTKTKSTTNPLRSRREAPSAPISTLYTTGPAPAVGSTAMSNLSSAASKADAKKGATATSTRTKTTTARAEASAAAVAAASAAALAAAAPAAASVDAATAAAASPRADSSAPAAAAAATVAASATGSATATATDLVAEGGLEAPPTASTSAPITGTTTRTTAAPVSSTSVDVHASSESAAPASVVTSSAEALPTADDTDARSDAALTPASDRSTPPLQQRAATKAAAAMSAPLPNVTHADGIRLSFNQLFTPAATAPGLTDSARQSQPAAHAQHAQHEPTASIPDSFQEPLDSARSSKTPSLPTSRGPGSVHGAHAYNDVITPPSSYPQGYPQSLPLSGVRRQASSTALGATGALSTNSGIFIDGRSDILKAEGGAPLGAMTTTQEQQSESAPVKMVKSLSRSLSQTAAAILARTPSLKSDRNPPKSTPIPLHEGDSSTESSNGVLPSDLSNVKSASQPMHDASSALSKSMHDSRSFIEQVTQPLPAMPGASPTSVPEGKTSTFEPDSAVLAGVTEAESAQNTVDPTKGRMSEDHVQSLLWGTAEEDFNTGATSTTQEKSKTEEPTKAANKVEASDSVAARSKSSFKAMKSEAPAPVSNKAVHSENKKVHGARSWLRMSESSEVRVEINPAFESRAPPGGGSAGNVDANLSLAPVIPGAMCGDIETVDVSRGDISKLRTIVGAWENFSKVFPGEFLTAHDIQKREREERMHARAVAMGAKPRNQLGTFGAETVAWIENRCTHVHALVFRNEHLKQVVVAIQGSKGFADWVRGFWPPSDPPSRKGKHLYPPLKMQRKAPGNVFEELERKKLLEGDSEQPGKLHAGWRHAWLSIEAETFAVVDLVTKEDPEWTVCTSGHSLGGALATVAAEAFATRADISPKQRVECYSFGAPRVGNHAWATHFDAVVDDSWRFTKLADVAPGYKFPFDVFHRHVKGGVALKSSSQGGTSKSTSIGLSRKRDQLQLAWSKATSEQVDAIGSEELQQKGWVEPVKEYSGVSGFAVARWRQVRKLFSKKRASTRGANSMHEFGDSILDVSLQILRSRPDSASAPLRRSTQPRAGNVAEQNIPDPSEVQRMEAAIMSVKALMHEVPRSKSSRY